ncbi:MAG: HAD family hydrolase [Chloroflexota bacterium]
MTIRALVFDFGGVLLRTEDHSPRIALAKRFGLSEGELERLVFASSSSIRASLGELDVEEHWREVVRTLGAGESDIETIKTEFFAGDRLDERLVMYLRQMRNQYHIGLLSNAWSDLRSFLHHRLGILDMFDEAVISAEVKMMKPQVEIYHYTARKLGVAPHEAVFVDDMQENVEGARAAGMQAILFRDANQLFAELNDLIQKV